MGGRSRTQGAAAQMIAQAMTDVEVGIGAFAAEVMLRASPQGLKPNVFLRVYLPRRLKPQRAGMLVTKAAERGPRRLKPRSAVLGG